MTRHPFPRIPSQEELNSREIAALQKIARDLALGWVILAVAMGAALAVWVAI